MILLQKFYRAVDYRNAELDFCINQVHKSPYISKVYYFCDINVDTSVIDTREKSVIIRFNEKEKDFTYNQYFEFANKHFSDNDIIILSNLDIFFDDSLQKVEEFFHIHSKTHVMAINRWDFDKKTLVSVNCEWEYSQDVWIWKGHLNTSGIDADFPLGKPGCDNRIAYELYKNYEVINPSRTVRTHHYHTSQHRAYRFGDLSITIPEPYKTLPLTSI